MPHRLVSTGCRHWISVDSHRVPNSVIQDATQEAELANEDMPDLRPPLFLAEEMGEGLGSAQTRAERDAKRHNENRIPRDPLLLTHQIKKDRLNARVQSVDRTATIPGLTTIKYCPE